MKILYIANVRIPTEKAHGIQIMKMCEAFANGGNHVELVIPKRFNNIKQNPFDYYGVKKNFKITKLPVLDFTNLGRFGFLVHSLGFAFLSVFYSVFKRDYLIYSRDDLSLYFLSFFRKNIFWEMHAGKKNFIAKRVVKKSRGIILITQSLRRFYEKEYGVKEDKIFVFPDAVDIEKFKIEAEKLEIRKKLNLPQNKKIVLYTGHLYSWKGVDTLIRSREFLDENTLVYLVGGTEKDIEEIKKQTEKISNIVVAGSQPYLEIPYWQKSADVLVLPNTAKEDISKYYTSPMKLFEYMASGVPIVASSLPSIKEILNENNSVLVNPDNPKELAEGIKKILQDYDFANRISKQAYEDVKNYTWEKRVKAILDFIKR